MVDDPGLAHRRLPTPTDRTLHGLPLLKGWRLAGRPRPLSVPGAPGLWVCGAGGCGAVSVGGGLGCGGLWVCGAGVRGSVGRVCGGLWVWAVGLGPVGLGCVGLGSVGLWVWGSGVWRVVGVGLGSVGLGCGGVELESQEPCGCEAGVCGGVNCCGVGMSDAGCERAGGEYQPSHHCGPCNLSLAAHNMM